LDQTRQKTAGAAQDRQEGNDLWALRQWGETTGGRTTMWC